MSGVDTKMTFKLAGQFGLTDLIVSKDYAVQARQKYSKKRVGFRAPSAQSEGYQLPYCNAIIARGMVKSNPWVICGLSGKNFCNFKFNNLI